MLVFAHPDDEVIAVGARMSLFQDGNFICVTDGAPRDQRDSQNHGFRSLEAYREARLHELNCAFELARIPRAKRQCLEYPDQEAAYHLPELAKTILKLFNTLGTQIVFTHPYEGGHPDHDAVAFAVHTAARLLESAAPLIIEAPFYHQGPCGIETGCFLDSVETEEIVFMLTDAEGARKQALLDCFTTQKDMLQYFSTEMERYRVSPQYVFTQPPHAGPVFYDNFDWGVTSDRFCRLANQAELNLMGARWALC